MLVLESAGGGDVTVRRRRGQEVEEIKGKRVIINRKAESMHVEGASVIRLVVPMLGPVPMALDFGFPVVKGRRHESQGANISCNTSSTPADVLRSSRPSFLTKRIRTGAIQQYSPNPGGTQSGWPRCRTA